MSGFKLHPRDAREWLFDYARPLELARYRFLFEKGPVEDVYAALGTYQNKDGGFGFGIEPDFTYPGSTAIGSWTAARILLELDATSDMLTVQHLVRYLIATQDKTTGMWATTIPEMNDYPRAPWWTWSEGAQDDWKFNPGVELAAYCMHWVHADGKAWDTGMLTMRKAIKRLMLSEDMDFHELSNFQYALRLVKHHFPEIEEETGFSFSQCQSHLNALIYQAVETEPDNWGEGYQSLPLDFVYTWRDADELGFDQPLVERQIQYWQDTRLDKGIWDINWQWGQFPEAFALARRAWQGILAVERYKKLQQLGMLHESEKDHSED